MSFASPLWLWALLLLPLVAAAEAWAVARDRERTARLVARPLWPRVVSRPAEAWRFVRLALLLLGAAGLVVALARPQWGVVREKVEREGVDVVLVLDTSASMGADDVSPSRFAVARLALLGLVERLIEDRFALVAFEGEAYTLVPLTLDADAVGLFLETLEPGFVPTPGTALGSGLARGLDLFVDRERRNKVMVLVSDGENLEGQVDAAVARAREAGVVIHTVGVGSERGAPVPEPASDGSAGGFKKDAAGAVVVSRLEPATLEAIARGTGGRFLRISTAETSLAPLAAAIEALDERALAREYVYRKKERFQLPLGVGLVALALALVLPLPARRRRAATALGRAAVVAGLAAFVAPAASAASAARGTQDQLATQDQVTTPGSGATGTPVRPAVAPVTGAARSDQGHVVDELLLRPRRHTDAGRSAWRQGDVPRALEAFERASGVRPGDPAVRFNLADALYKSGKLDEAAQLYEALGRDAGSRVAAPALYNLGNTRFDKQDYRGAVAAYRDALRLMPEDLDTRRNLERSLRALKEQKQQQRQQQQQQNQQDQGQDQKQDQSGQQNQGQDQKEKQQDPSQQQSDQQNQEHNQRQNQGQKPDSPRGQSSPQQKPGGSGQGAPQTPAERERQRFEREAGMPPERARQLLEALEQNEKAEQRRLLAERRKKARAGKDW